MEQKQINGTLEKKKKKKKKSHASCFLIAQSLFSSRSFMSELTAVSTYVCCVLIKLSFLVFVLDCHIGLM